MERMLSLEEVVLVTGALCVRAMMSIHPHSGQDQPPMYGDFEAQRHWQVWDPYSIILTRLIFR